VIPHTQTLLQSDMQGLYSRGKDMVRLTIAEARIDVGKIDLPP
jgi:hypothetical protein